MAPRTIAIVGGGCSGTLTAAHLLAPPVPERGRPRVVLIERSSDVGPGVAHATACEAHLLNVRAGDMSALASDHGDFVRWLRQFGPGFDAASFVPRRLYGDYLRTIVREAQARAGEPAFVVLRGQVTDLVAAPGRPLTLRCRHGASLQADAAVLAVGHLPPRTPAAVSAAVEDSGRYFGEPWSADGLERIPPGASVLLLGTGLTAVDAVLALASQGHTGPIRALSRHGLLPLPHRPAAGAWPDHQATGPDPAGGATARHLLRSLRARAAAASATGDDWRSVVDGMRAESNCIWQNLPEAEQRRILRHLRTYWNVHRHRMAPEAAAWIGTLRARGQLSVGAGRLDSCEPGTGGLRVGIRHPQPTGRQTSVIEVGYLVNCTGPEVDVTAAGDPLFDSLLARGLACPGALGMGLAVTDEGSLLDRSATADERLWAIGPLRQGTLWETTAVPELRGQAAALAARLLTTGHQRTYQEAV